MSYLEYAQYDNTPNYQKIFGSYYTNALHYFEKRQSVITTHFNYHAVNQELIVPVIFPERVHYSMVRDFLETTAAKLIYIDLGADYVDFSIDDLQIKPSFAEKVKKYIASSTQLSKKYKLLTDFDPKKARSIRKERARRLKL